MRVVTRTRPTLHFAGAMTWLLRVFWCVVVITFLASVSYAFDLLVPAESFETDGQTGAGNRYLSNQHTDGGANFFQWHNFTTTNPHPSNNEAITSFVDSVAFAGKDVNTADNPLGAGSPAILRLNDLTVTGNNMLVVKISLACSSDDVGPGGW